MFNEREQPTGEAYVEFSTADDRERAMTKDRQHMGGRCAAAGAGAVFFLLATRKESLPQQCCRLLDHRE